MPLLKEKRFKVVLIRRVYAVDFTPIEAYEKGETWAKRILMFHLYDDDVDTATLEYWPETRVYEYGLPIYYGDEMPQELEAILIIHQTITESLA